MSFMPFQIVGSVLRGLLAIVVLCLGVYLLYDWSTNRTAVYMVATPPRSTDPAGSDAARPVIDPPSAEMTLPQSAQDQAAQNQLQFVGDEHPPFGANRETAWLVVGGLCMAWSLAGRWLVPVLGLKRSGDAPQKDRHSEVRKVTRPDGTVLHVEISGSEDRPPVIFTHGWGMDRKEWSYARSELENKYRVIVWDLPGLGKSSRPSNQDWSLEKLAGDLQAVLTLAGGRPAVLAGHSIGGMITLTFCRLFPEDLGTRVSGLVLTQTTYTNPVRTTRHAAIYTALQKPLIEPLCHLMVWLAPVFWVLNWMSFLNGSAHRSTHRSAFSGNEALEQLNFLTRYVIKSWPAVMAHGYLAMLKYDATEVLATIPVPSLIIAGDDDSTCTPEASVFMGQQIPQARLTTLKPARHCGLVEHHAQFAATVGPFIDQCANRNAMTVG